MSILPKNEKKKPVDTPRNYFIYGAPMSGKSYLANEFPSPLFIGTDGNSAAYEAPAVEIRNIKGKDGAITSSVIDQLGNILVALQNENHGYKTVVIDVIEDLVDMIKIAVANAHGVKSLSEVKWGKGFDYFNAALTELILDLKALPLNVIYISREVSEFDNEGNVTGKVPALKDRFTNLVNGNCDIMLQTEKVGNNYYRKVDRRRKSYKAEHVGDKDILAILQTIRGALDAPAAKTNKF